MDFWLLIDSTIYVLGFTLIICLRMNLFGLCLKLSKKQNCAAPYLALFEQILDQCLTSGFVQMCEGEREA